MRGTAGKLARLCASALVLAALPAAIAIPLSVHTHRELARAQKHLEAGESERALAILEPLAGQVAGRPGEAAIVAQNLGYARAQAGQPERAAESLRAALAAGLPDAALADSVRLDLAQLDLQIGAHAEAADLLEEWLRHRTDAPPRVHILAATANYELKRPALAIRHARKAIAGTAAPPEDWMRLLVALYFEAREYRAAADLLREMLRRFPERTEYWIRLADAHQLRGEAPRAAAALDLARRLGRLPPSEYPRLARLHMQTGSPYAAAKLLDDALREGTVARDARQWSLLADAWILAREPSQALAALAEVEKLSQDAEASLRRARILVEQERWAEAVAVLDTLLALPAMAGRGDVHLLMGVAAYEHGDTARARDAFRAATRDAATAERAGRWIEYLEEVEKATTAQTIN